ncbi:MAG: hypothetical protein JEZ00_20095 [Anaerolineaceae bacterium]|nr:hypothetical protein [Anaerolineaceae bacterium]
MSDVNQTDTFGYQNIVTGTGLNMQQTVPSNSNDLAIDFVNKYYASPVTSGSGQTLVLNSNISGRNQALVSSKVEASEMSWSWTGAIRWIHHALVIHPMGYATPTPTLTPTNTSSPTSTPTLTPTPTPLDWPTPIQQTPQTAGVYQESDPAWQYTGLWENITDSADSGGARMDGTLPWASAQLSFTGNQITYTYRKGPEYGIAEVYVAPADGSGTPIKIASIDQYNASVQAAQTSVLTLPESAQARMLIIRRGDRNNPDSSGYKINLDAVSIGTEAEITLAPTRSPTNMPLTSTSTVVPLGISLKHTANNFSNTTASSSILVNVPEEGNNRILIVGVYYAKSTAVMALPEDLLSITFNGQQMQLAAQNTAHQVSQVWYLLNPSVGWHDLEITFNGVMGIRFGSAVFTGVDQAEPFSAISTKHDVNRRSFTSVTSPTGDVALAFFNRTTCYSDNDAHPAAGLDMTEILSNGSGTCLAMATKPGQGYTYMEYSWDHSLYDTNITILSLRKYNPTNVTSTPTITPTPGDSPTPTLTPDAPTALPTTGMFTQDYHYDTSQPHAVTHVDREFRQDHFSYDANGNQITRLVDGVNYTLGYDAENRIETVTDTAASQTWSFDYDGNGTRIRQINPDGSQTLLLNGGRYHVEIAADSSVETTRYYSIAGQRPAMRNHDGSINYLMGDHLGSVSTVVNASGVIVSQSRYLPFGEVLWAEGTSPTDYSYTGQRSLSEIGLMDYNARFYDPLLGRFITPDSIVPNKSMISNWNTYSYVINNPIQYNDPTGYNQECTIGEWWCWNDDLRENIVDEIFSDLKLDKTLDNLNLIVYELRVVNERMNPFIGSFDNDIYFDKTNSELYNSESDAFGYSHHDLDLEFEWLYENLGIDLVDICKSGKNNPITAKDTRDSGSVVLANDFHVTWRLFKINGNNEALTEFLKVMKVESDANNSIGQFNYEPNYLDACMKANQNQLISATYNLVKRLVERKMQGLPDSATPDGADFSG